MNRIGIRIAEWWMGSRLLIRRAGFRLTVWTGTALVLWTAGAWFSTRHEAYLPKPNFVPVDLDKYVKDPINLGGPDSVSAAYASASLEINKLMETEKAGWNYSGSFEGLLNDFAKNGEMKGNRTNDFLAFEKLTDDTVNKLREKVREATRLQPLRRFVDKWERGYRWEPLWKTVSMLGTRTFAAGVRGDSVAWRTNMDDLLHLLELLNPEAAPRMVGSTQSALMVLKAGLAAGCRSGVAFDDGYLRHLDECLNKLKPLDTIEPMQALTYAYSQRMTQMDAYYYGYGYPWSIYENVHWWSFMDPEIDAPIKLLGFEARDQALYTSYMNTLIKKVRTRPIHEAWRWAKEEYEDGHLLGRAQSTAPRYSDIVESFGGNRSGGIPIYNEAHIRLARAAIAVIRQVHAEGGVVKEDRAFWANYLKDFTSTFTGEPVELFSTSDGCRLFMPIYSYSRHRDYTRDHSIQIKLSFPPAGKVDGV